MGRVYIKMGVRDKLLDNLQINRTKEESGEWIMEVWEPAHQIELALKDVKADITFKLFNDHIQALNDIINLLGIRKGLEHDLQAAEEAGEKFYKLRTMIFFFLHILGVQFRRGWRQL